MTELLALLWSFTKIGFTSFGGLSMIPLINSEMSVHGWMTAEEISDIVAIAEMTPGPLGLNCATFAGMRVAGLLGAIMANIGILLPSFTVCALAALFFERFKNSRALGNIMTGVRPACIGMIWAIILDLAHSNYFVAWQPQWDCMLIGAAAFVLLVKFKWSITRVILLSAAAGVLLCR